MFQALGVPDSTIGTLEPPLCRQSGSASAILYRQLLVALMASLEPPLPLVTCQARLESDVHDPQPGVTAGSRHMFQALGGLERSPAFLYVSHWLVRHGVRAPLVELLG